MRNWAAKQWQTDSVDKDEARFSGSYFKILRIHETLSLIGQLRGERKYDELLYPLERLFAECEAHCQPKERDKAIRLHKEMLEWAATPNSPQLQGVTLLLELTLRRVLARMQLDVEMKPKKTHLRGAFS